jgi:tRNA A-37 threonylcarbamoyl transferase component Bud32
MAELSKLGRYELRRVLGKGAMGVVYEGFDPTLNRRVAVKTILRSVALDAETQRDYSARFVREAQAVARLNHPHIVQVHDFGEHDEVAYLVMEFIEGRELRAFFDEGVKFDTGEAVRIIRELLDALEFAHEKNVIHRDVKPANVMLDAQRQVKLADFGVARVQDSERSQAGTMVGTPAFMSPEQIQGWKIDRRTDVFSAGVILYQLLTGQQPFKGEGAWTVARKIIQDDPPLPSSIAGSVAPAFDDIVYKALAKKPVDRFATAKEFRAALRAALKGTAATGAAAPAIAAPKPKAREESRASEAEIEFWRALQNSSDPAEFEFYLEQFPDGTYAPLARHKIAKLREAPESQATVRMDAEERARQEAVAKAKREVEENNLREALEKARREAAEKAQREAEEKARHEASEKLKREAAEKAKRDSEEKIRQAQALARLRQQEEAAARARVAVDEDATVAIGDARPAVPSPAPPAIRKSSLALPAIGAAVLIVAAIGAYLFLGRKPAPAPVAEIAVPPKVQAPAPASAPAAPPKAELSTADVDKIRKETEERIRREYADKSAAEQAKAAKAAADKAVQEKQLAVKAAAEKAAQEKQLALRLAAERAAAEKAIAEKIAAERAAGEKAARVAAEKAAEEKAAAAKEAEEKAAAAKAAEKAAAAAKTPPVTVAAAAPAAVTREGMVPGRYTFRITAGGGVSIACERIGVQEDIEIRGGSGQSISGGEFKGLQFQSVPAGQVAATIQSLSAGRFTSHAKLSGRATVAGYAGTYDWSGGNTACTGQWTLVRKGS